MDLHDQGPEAVRRGSGEPPQGEPGFLTSADKLRRRLGLMVLGTALAMLMAGLSVLRPRLAGLGYIVYWLACYVLTSLAILLAIVDMHIIKQRIHRERRMLELEHFGDDTGAGGNPRHPQGH